MSRYSEQTIKSVNDNADIRDIIPGADPGKTKQNLDCPFCGAKKKFGVTHNSKYNSAKCFACGEGFANPISAWMHYQGYGSDKYPVAIEEVAKMANMTISTEEEEQNRFNRDQQDRVKDTFCSEQLEASGLKVEDVMATTFDGKSESKVSPFQPGTFGPGYRIDPLGSDMMIYYIDLHGRYMTYMAKGSSVPRRYGRVRYANPDLHKVNDKPVKYRTPEGAPSYAFITEYIRRKFQNKEHIETLYLQEGEKKAEKACKHGMPSIGIQGITNIGKADSGLIQEIQDVVRVCGVRNVVLMMDSDWSDLHREIKVNDRVDKRPNNFASAVVKFKQFMASFHNLGIEVEAWWGHVNDNVFCDKGIDDLLCNTLRSRESDLMQDAERAMSSTNGKGEFVTIVKISTMTDMKIRDFWHLNDHQAFYDCHRKRLSKVPSFRLGGFMYKVENDKIIAMSRYSSNADIYSVTKNDKDKKKVSLNYTETFRWLSDSGFKIFVDPDAPKDNDYEFVYINNGIIEPTSDFHIRRHVCDYIEKNAKDPDVYEYFNAKIDALLNEKKLQRLEVVENLVAKPEALKSHFYYNNGKVEISPSGIVPELLLQNVWRKSIVSRPFKRIPVIKEIIKGDNGFTVDISDMGAKCDFLMFLLNTSNNFYKAGQERDFTPEEAKDVAQHLVNKITALGYLLSEWKPDGERKSVVIQDHLMSEVGQNSGRAGKSLIGMALSQVIDQEFIIGSKFDPGDRFAFDNVTRNTKNIFIDDVKPNFNFKLMYPLITGNFVTERKQIGKLVIPVELSPKMLITTNHTINSSTEDSSKDRIIYMEFSNWYSADYSPYMDFGHYFFSEWDELQWCLFDNLMAECVMYYFRAYEQEWSGKPGVGAVPPPMSQIAKRSLRQFMSEVFYQWAEEYYDPTGEHLNAREFRNDILKDFLSYAGDARHGVTQSNISKRIHAYCKFKGYAFNPDKQDKQGRYYSDWVPTAPEDVFIGGLDKSGGKEYFTVYSSEKPYTPPSSGGPF